MRLRRFTWFQKRAVRLQDECQVRSKGIGSGDRRIGLLAGWGRYPIVVAQHLRAQGYRTYCLGLWDHADPCLQQLCDGFRWVGLGRLGAAIRFFKRNAVCDATMAGKFHKMQLFQPWAWIRHLPDMKTIRAFIPHFLTRQKDCKDDSLLGTLVNTFAADGIRFAPATDYAPGLLVGHGQLTRQAPSAWLWKDIAFGWQLAKEMGRLDIGQSVAVKDQAVLAVEAVEGTDQCIRRAGSLCRAGGFTVVKVAKPQQDMRFDVPTIGLGTLQTMVESGARALAIEAGRTILLDQAEVLAYANQHKLTLVALQDGEVLSGAPSSGLSASVRVSSPTHSQRS